MFKSVCFSVSNVKTEFIRKLSNFNFQWTKTFYQNNLNNIAFFFTFFKGYRYNKLSVITPKTIFMGARDENTAKILKITCAR